MPDNSQEKVGEVSVSQETADLTKKSVKNIGGLERIIESTLGADTSRLIESLLLGGIYLEASDLHFEPGKTKTKIRARIDGVLQNVTDIENSYHNILLSRIKLLSGLKINVGDRPQDGRFSVVLKEGPVEIRTSTLPAEYGEAIVLRILNPKTLLSLEELGVRKDLLDILKTEVKRPNGMIIVTGPTGSGKTTTLYSFLNVLQRPEIKIITIEDPIEYHIQGISQTQVNPAGGYDFASGLQSIMRQDPDVILVGEIRDAKTCQIALQSALTGHLVFTTLHTNDAAGTIARLTSLGGDLKNIGPAVNLAIAQRLVRRVCPACGKLEPILSEALVKMKKILAGLPKEISVPQIKKGLRAPVAKGCKACNNTGYKGRIGIFEILLIDEEIERFIIKNPSIADLRERAIEKGMVTIEQDGVIKVLTGLTTIEELEREIGF